jgi:pyridoxine kinase
LQHYRSLDIEFECIYSGFLSSKEQFDHCTKFFSAYPDALAVVDPVMGDHGRRYRTVTDEMCSRMRSLVSCADVITPNVTEVSLLLGEQYEPGELSAAQARSLLVRLSELGPSRVIITSVELSLGERLANVGYDRTSGKFWYTSGEYIPVNYPGTGDLFAAVLTGGLLSGNSLPIAMSRAAHFVERAIKTTYSYGADPRYGVMFEMLLGELTSSTVGSDYHLL